MQDFSLDADVPDLLIFHPSFQITSSWLQQLVASGELIIQDKASCLPAVVLDPSPSWHIVDACAAPGNKTSQLLAIMALKQASLDSSQHPPSHLAFPSSPPPNSRSRFHSRLSIKRPRDGADSQRTGCDEWTHQDSQVKKRKLDTHSPLPPVFPVSSSCFSSCSDFSSSLSYALSTVATRGRLDAFERDRNRYSSLRARLIQAGACVVEQLGGSPDSYHSSLSVAGTGSHVSVHHGDFLDCNPLLPQWQGRQLKQISKNEGRAGTCTVCLHTGSVFALVLDSLFGFFLVALCMSFQMFVLFWFIS